MRECYVGQKLTVVFVVLTGRLEIYLSYNVFIRNLCSSQPTSEGSQDISPGLKQE
jgi:hypothetical protein